MTDFDLVLRAIAESELVNHSQWCEQFAEQDFEYVGCTCGALKYEARQLAMEREAARYRKLRGLMNFGEFAVSRHIGDYLLPFDYPSDMDAGIDEASQAVADAGLRSELSR